MGRRLQDVLLFGVKVDNSVHNYGAGKLTTSEHVSKPLITVIAAIVAILFCFLVYYFRHPIKKFFKKKGKEQQTHIPQNLVRYRTDMNKLNDAQSNDSTT